MRRRTVEHVLAIYLAAGSVALAAEPDPFDALFGDEPERVDAGTSDSAGRDDFKLIRLTLGRYELAGTLAGYDTAGGLCIAAAPFFEAIEFPIEIQEASAAGWFIDPGRRFALDFAARTGRIANETVRLDGTAAAKTPDGWCLTLGALSDLLPLDFDYDKRLLRLQVKPREVLPVEARLERLALRQRWTPRDTDSAIVSYPLIDNPYRWLDWPTADLVLTGGGATGQNPNASLSVEAVGDVLKFTGRLRSVSTQQNGLSNLRLTMSRANDRLDWLGGARLRAIVLGDTVSQPLPLLEPARAGRGAVVTNEPSNRSAVFDVVQVRGALPVNWEAELYDGDRLIGFVTEPDDNGEYVFDDVVLTSGYNRLTVKLFGPFGEYEEREERVFVGPELWPKGSLFFSAGIVDPETPLFRGAELGSSVLTEDATDEAEDLDPLAYLSVYYGLTERVSLRLDALGENGLENGRMTASLFSSALGAYGAMSVTSGGYGRPAFEISAARPIGSRLNVSTSYTHFGDLESSISGAGASRLLQRAALRLNATVPLGTKVITALTAGSLEDRADGTVDMSVKQTLASALYGVNWSNTLEWSQSRPTGGKAARALAGSVLLSRPVQGVRFRSTLDYALTDGFEPVAASAAAQAALGARGQGSFGYTYGFDTGLSNVDIGYSHSFDRYAFSTTLGANSNGEWRFGMSLAFALYRDSDQGAYRIGPSGLTRTGAIRAQVFEDANLNGRFDEGERPIENAQLILGDTLRDEETDPDGQAVLGGLPPDRPLNAALKLASLNDPFLRPTLDGAAVAVRPGQVKPMAFPVALTGEADGRVVLFQDGERAGIADATVEAVDGTGAVIASAQTEFDGYFYLGGLHLGTDLTLRIASGDLTASGLTAPPVTIRLESPSPSALGQTLTIVPAS